MLNAFSSIWLADWSSHSDYVSDINSTSTNDPAPNATIEEEDGSVLVSTKTDYGRDVYLSVYGAFGVGQAIASVIGTIILQFSTLNGARKLHSLALGTTLKLPLAFFETTPQGRILNRYDTIGLMKCTGVIILDGTVGSY